MENVMSHILFPKVAMANKKIKKELKEAGERYELEKSAIRDDTVVDVSGEVDTCAFDGLEAELISLNLPYSKESECCSDYLGETTIFDGRSMTEPKTYYFGYSGDIHFLESDILARIEASSPEQFAEDLKRDKEERETFVEAVLSKFSLAK